jgi:ribonuclease P protein component
MEKKADSAEATAKRRPRLRHPRICRMRTGADFSRVYREGVRVRGTFILLVAAPSLNPSNPRLGLSVGRKFSKKAVLRNRVRRVLRESFRLARPEMPALDMVLIPIAKDQAYSTPVCKTELQALSHQALAKWQRRQQGS